MALDNPQAVAKAVQNTSTGIGGDRTIPSSVRIYSPRSVASGSGLPNASRALAGRATTILSDTALGTTLALGIGGGAYLARDR